MALHLITGVPGAGKTLNTLIAVHKMAKEQGRVVYYRGIKLLRDNSVGINFDNWIEMRHPSEDGVDLNRDITPWTWQNAPDGSIIFVDEAHHFYPATSPTARQPPYIMDMSEHRHRGFDIFLITQGPDLINGTIKNWVAEHTHYRNLFGGLLRRAYINEKTVNNIRNTRELAREATKKRYKLDERWYDAYVSASVHRKKKRFPTAYVTMLLFGFALLLGGGLWGYHYFQTQRQGIIQQHQPAYQHGEYPQGPLKGNVNPSLSGVQDVSMPSPDAFNPLTAYQPRIEAMPETAPAYDDLRKPQTWPKPQCLINRAKDQCSCYTQQATVMQDYPDELCRSYATRGYFDPTRKDREPPPPESKSAREEPAAPAPALPFAFIAQTAPAPAEPANTAMATITAQP